MVVGIGMTEAAAKVPIIFDVKDENGKQIAYGDLAKDINDLPIIVAKYVITEATRLFPEKAKESVGRIVDSIIKKFKTN